MGQKGEYGGRTSSSFVSDGTATSPSGGLAPSIARTDILQYAMAFTSILQVDVRVLGSPGLGMADADARRMDVGWLGRGK